MDNQDDLRKAYHVSAVVGIAIIASLFIYLVIVFMLRPESLTLATVQSTESLRYVFYGLSVVIVIVLRLLRGLLLRQQPSDARRVLIGKLQRTSILSMALSEGPAVFGLVLFFLGGMRRDFIILLFVSLVLVFMHFPRLRNWEGWLASQESCGFRP